MLRRFVFPNYHHRKFQSSCSHIICFRNFNFAKNNQFYVSNQITSVETDISDAIAKHHKNKRERNYYNKDQKYESFPLTPVIQKWLDVELFQEPDREILGSNLELLCRWLIVSGELLIGEDHVDWACEALWNHHHHQSSNSSQISSDLNPRLCLRTINAFEKWMIKEIPQCFGMIPLLKNISSNILSCTSKANFNHNNSEHFHYMISAEDVAVMIGSIMKIFRKKSKGDTHLPIPEPLDAAVADVMKSLATRYLTSENIQQFEEWTCVVARFFKVGVRRLPLTLSTMVESLFDPVTKTLQVDNNNNSKSIGSTHQTNNNIIPTAQHLQLRILRSKYYGIVFNKLKQRNELTSASLSRQVIDALSVMQDIAVVVDDAENNNGSGTSLLDKNPTWRFLFASPLFSVVTSQMAKWPLRDIGVVTTLCLRYLSESKIFVEQQSNADRRHHHHQYLHQARTLLILSIRCSYYGFFKIVRDSANFEGVITSTSSENKSTMMTVESALCANRFLDLIENSIPNDVMIAASSGLPEVMNKHVNEGRRPQETISDNTAINAMTGMMNVFGTIEEPARIISSRFPHLVKK